jgi:serine/threonine protein kinase
MGQVYRATDTKLKRQVAIKILPPALAGDPDRLARFQREAEVLALLNHPNIAAIYGLEDTGGLKALVMELVEGEDLAQWIELRGDAARIPGTWRCRPIEGGVTAESTVPGAFPFRPPERPAVGS